MKSENDSINFTEFERLVLSNQYTQIQLLKEIASKLPEKEPKRNWATEEEKAIEILEKGIEAWYPEISPLILSGCRIPRDVTDEVGRIMNMYVDLINSYFALDQKDRDQICFKDVRFQGFDNNEAVNHHLYADFLVKKINGFPQLFRNEKGEQIDPAKTNFNFIHGSLDQYQQMHDKYKKLTETSIYNHGELSRQNIQEILPSYCETNQVD